MNLFGFINPQVYLLGLLYLPFYRYKFIGYTIGFVIGILIDIPMLTVAMNGLAALIMMTARKPLFLLFLNDVEKDQVEMLNPSNLDRFQQFLFIIITVLIYHIVLYTVGYFKLADVWLLFPKMLINWIVSVICIYIAYILLKSYLIRYEQ